MAASHTHAFFAQAAHGIEPLLADELNSMGALSMRVRPGGVEFRGSLESAYRACLWSRTAGRILFFLSSFPASHSDELYAGIRQTNWQEHFSPDESIAVGASLHQSAIDHSQFAALRVKDAVVDFFRDKAGRRPSVDTTNPDIRLHIHIRRDIGYLYIDLSGESLYKRGYRLLGGPAPMKENLAAAILMYARWRDIAARGGSFVDLMCGSGSFPIEAAMIAADIAPGLNRTFGYEKWRMRDEALSLRLLAEAKERKEAGISGLPPIFGFDTNERAIIAAQENAARAGLENCLHFRRSSLGEFSAKSAGIETEKSGLILVNPPYGERLGEEDRLRGTYALLGQIFRRDFRAWEAGIFSGNRMLLKELRLRPRRSRRLYNGSIECLLQHYRLEKSAFFREDLESEEEESHRDKENMEENWTSGAIQLANRLRKNMKTLGRWVRKNDIHCYRLYDADIPQYSFALDIYEDRAHIQEYLAPKSIDPARAKERLREALEVISTVLSLPRRRMFLKVRQRQRGKAQYSKLKDQSEYFEVRESDCVFLVNLSDYLDTGLFLDHRLMREFLRSLSEDKDFLNLFSYTGSATVAAAKGGARSTVSVDMSAKYLDWAKQNMERNGFRGSKYDNVQADCLEWLESERRKFDLIFLDPPTFSNSKKMNTTFDVQRDHPALIRSSIRLLAPDGILIFSTNCRNFSIETDLLGDLQIENFGEKYLPADFSGKSKSHHVFRFSK